MSKRKTSDAMDWTKPKAADQLTQVFGPSRIDDYLPAFSALPQEFQRERNAWCQEASNWFFGCVKPDTVVLEKQGINPEAALRHLGCCLRSFEPKHEHKIAGVGYLMSLWFEQFGAAKHEQAPAP